MAEHGQLIDCDVHESTTGLQDLYPYLDGYWLTWIKNVSARAKIPPIHPYIVAQGSFRADAIRADGSVGSAHVEQLKAQLLDQYNVKHAILTGQDTGMYLSSMPQAEFATALASAYNEWLLREFLPRDDRLLGSVTVAAQNPDTAAEEIRRVGTESRMIQTILPIHSPEVAWGNPRYEPMWAAAEHLGLPVAFHVSPAAGLMGSPTQVGWPRSYLELRATYPLVFQATLISLVCGGVFVRHPNLKVVLVEGGFAWLPGVMWRLDQSWRALRDQLPWLVRKPSEYIRDHVRLTTQPMEEPDDPRDVGRIIDMMGSDDLVMFSSDYPHWDFDDPYQSFPRSLPASTRSKILYKNAAAFYGL